MCCSGERDPTPDPDLPRLLGRWREGDETARSDLYEMLYRDLYRRAQRMMDGQPVGHTLQPSALVNEAFLKLARNPSFADETHFLATASRAMRQVLVDHARSKRGKRKAGTRAEIALDQLVGTFEEQAYDLEGLHIALEELEKRDPQMASAVEMRFFGGQSAARVADILGISVRTFDRHWTATRAWLRSRIPK